MAQLRSSTVLLLCLGLLAACGGAPAADTPVPLPEGTTSWQAHVLPLLGDYCLGCHSGEEPDGSLDLTSLAESAEPPSPDQLRTSPQFFEQVASHVLEGVMPPEGEPGPPEEMRAAFGAWFVDALEAAWTAAPPNPGRVTMRRLSRAEYRNTVRDLLGVDFDPRPTLPADEVGYGFDHIGDVLSMSPLLFEKYLAAAEAIASAAIHVVHPDERAARRFLASDTEIQPERGRAKGGGVVLSRNGQISQRVRVPRTGMYHVRVRASAQQAGADAARMEIRLGRRVLRSVAVQATVGQPRTYSVRARLEAGPQTLSAAFMNDYYAPKHRDPKLRGDRNLHVAWLELEGPLEAGTAPLAERHPLVFAYDQDATAGQRGTEVERARRVLQRLLARAFRRPARAPEVERHLQLVMSAWAAGEPYEGGLQVALEAVLVSPHFLFRVELDERADAGAPVIPLGDHALASRLAYFLWGSMPDETLRARADAGTLRPQLHAEVVRMLADPKARALVESFAVQWLELRRLDVAAPDVGRYKGFNEALRRDMREETERFFAAIVDEDRSILDLLDAPFTYLNARLAKHYGVTGVEGSHFRRVDLPGSARGGLLGQGSILTLTSYPTRTSVVQRGKWLLQEILGTPPPPPPPGVGTLEEQSPELLKLSLRERLAAHRENPDCAVCHDRMDNLGYGLENFDAVGAWRTREGMSPVDSRGTLPDGRSFSGVRELKRILREDPSVPRCFAQKLLVYALGRGLEPYDRPALMRIVGAARAKNFRFSSFVHAIVASDAFTMRRGMAPHALAGESK